MTVCLTRKQLYELVWSEATKHVAKQIGISEATIARICGDMKIPVPDRRYWKLKTKHALKRIPLPPRDLGIASRVEVSGTLPPELKSRITGEQGDDAGEGESIDVLAERFRARLDKVSVPRDFTHPHPIVAKLQRRMEAAVNDGSFMWMYRDF